MKLKKGFVLREVCGEKVIVGEGVETINFGKLISLNETAALLWKKAVELGDFTVEQLADALTEEYVVSREQALNDVKYPKVIVNNLIRSVEDIKIDLINENEGIYSGYYIPLTDYNIKYQDIVRFLKSNCFLEYIKAVGKYKNGGYYTFSSKELEKYLNYSVFEREIYELINPKL